jgi:Ca-activated chloride channel family protein
MLEWATPLWFLALPVALIAPWLVRGPRVRMASLRAMRAPPTLRWMLAWLPQAAASLGLVLLTVGLARPQLVDRERVVESEGIDILLVLDTSGSMEAEDFHLGSRAANRLEVAKEVVARFVDGRKDDRVGLVVFGEEAFTQVPLTLDHDALVDFLRQVQIGMAGARQTAIGDAIAVAGRRLKELDAESRVMILLTDGRSNAGSVEPLEAAEAAKALGIRIYTIGVGSKDGGGIFGIFGGRRRGELDEATLRMIAKKTGAQYFRAADTEALAEVYRTIDKLEKTTAESREFVHREEVFHPWVWSGLAMLLLNLLLGETVLRRLP